MTAHLELHLLGPFLTLKEGVPLEGFRSDKVRALLAYLALEGRTRPLRRSAISELLWPGYTEETARHSLRTALHNLRQLLAPLEIVQATRQTVQLVASDQELWCDAQELETILADMPDLTRSEAPLPPHLQRAARQAVALYQGELLQGFDLPDCPDFMAWQRARQLRYRQQVAILRSALERRSVQPAGNLPRPLTPLIGRQDEVASLVTKVLNPAYPIITLVGEGGVGKTRLALAVAERMRSDFADGVWFVPLEDLHVSPRANDEATAFMVDTLASAVASALDVITTGQNSPLQALLQHLADKRLLLVLDGFEAFVSAADLAVRLAQTSPHITVLVTSRQRLNLQAEYVVRLQALHFPAAVPSDIESDPRGFSGVDLFLERAERAGFSLRPQPAEWQDIANICRLVEGLPLGVELAAAQLEHCTVHDIAHSIQSSFDRLTTTMHDVPPRQRSLYAVFESSWALLTPRQARAMACCSVFRRGVTADAARAVADVKPEELTGLVNASLLRCDDGDRYQMHGFIQEAAACKLAAMGELEQQVRGRYCAYYADLVARHQPSFGSDRRAVELCTREAANLIKAWNLALEHDDEATLAKMVRGMSQLSYLNGVIEEGAHAFSHTTKQLREASLRRGGAPSPVLGRVLLEQSFFQEQLGHPAEAARAAQEALAIGEHLGDGFLLTGGHLRLAAISWMAGDYAASEAAMQAALKHVERAGDPRLELVALFGLGNTQSQQRCHLDAIATLEQARQKAQAFGDQRLVAAALFNLAAENRLLGHLWRAHELRRESVQTCRTVGDTLGLASSTTWLASDLCLLGDWEAGRRYVEDVAQMLTQNSRAQDRCHLAVVEAMFLLVEGAAGRAVELAARWLPTAEQASVWPAVVALLTTQAQALLTLGRLDEAFAAYQQVLAVAQRLAASEDVLAAQVGLAQVHLALGDHGAALALADAVAQLADVTDYYDRMLEYPNLYLTGYQVLQALDDPRAKTVLRAGVGLLKMVAAEIPDPAAQRRFLSGIPANRQLLQIAAARGKDGEATSAVVG